MPLINGCGQFVCLDGLWVLHFVFGSREIRRIWILLFFFFVCFIVMAVRSFGADSSNCAHNYANFSFSRALNNNHSTHTGDWMKVCISSNCTTKKNSPEMHCCWLYSRVLACAAIFASFHYYHQLMLIIYEVFVHLAPTQHSTTSNAVLYIYVIRFLCVCFINIHCI